ncbi:uncharacterized protein DSM5745_10385 [Aspergillus mulundensis]|uniref:Uncharacterized protein n=1 Tax=Aspergillus mulundensis TaxID=1810919 RepID=A0A3D8QIQ6_9EURO|nr:hypothetical protein DSM5745_10385 [Aspergillus mulundensis]RDW61713.1 hypothetical protein DSM5745_10385 [Aspergillus mulundensis]
MVLGFEVLGLVVALVAGIVKLAEYLIKFYKKWKGLSTILKGLERQIAFAGLSVPYGPTAFLETDEHFWLSSRALHEYTARSIHSVASDLRGFADENRATSLVANQLLEEVRELRRSSMIPAGRSVGCAEEGIHKAKSSVLTEHHSRNSFVSRMTVDRWTLAFLVCLAAVAWIWFT